MPIIKGDAHETHEKLYETGHSRRITGVSMITKLVPEKRYRIKMLKNTMFGDSVLLRKDATLVISSYLAHPSGNSPFPVRKWAAKIGNDFLIFKREENGSMFIVTGEAK